MRETELLNAAADAMADGRDPFHESFLVEHDVSLNEVYDMSETIALAVRLFLAAQKNPTLLVALIAQSAGGADVAEAAMAAGLMDSTTKKLKALGSRG